MAERVLMPAGLVPLGPRPGPGASWARATASADEWLVCGVLALLWFAATAWLRPLAIPDEGRYVGVAREMLSSGNWSVPTLNGLPFFHKPPLFYWITAASMAIFGESVEAARVASLMAATAAATGLFAFVRHWAGRQQAWSAVIVLATMPLFYGGAQYANLDMLVAACITGAVLLAAQAFLSREAGLSYRGPLLAAFGVAALGVLAKGLIGVVLPVLVLLAWGLAMRRMLRMLALLVWAPGVLAFIVIAAPWFIAMQARYPGFGHYFFVVQHIERFTSGSFNNAQAPWFYAVVLAVLTLPWSLALMTAGRRHYWARPDRGHVRLLMQLWLVVVVVFFSLPNSKLVGYILPAVPPLAFLIVDAWSVAQMNSKRAGVASPHGVLASRSVESIAAVMAVVCVSTVLVLHFSQPKSSKRLADAVRTAQRLDDQVVFVGNYSYDFAFYAHLKSPVTVVDAWAANELAKDSWRRELADAALFAAPSARPDLLTPADLPTLLCGTQGTWVVAPTATQVQPLAKMRPLRVAGQTGLWHFPPAMPLGPLVCGR